MKPEGERKFTSEWLLYNLLEMKYLEGKKSVRLSIKLSISEADLYRKQRIGLQEVGRELLNMEAAVRKPAY